MSCCSPHKGNLWFLSVHPIWHWGTAEFWQLTVHFPNSPVFRPSVLSLTIFQKDISPILNDKDCWNSLLPLYDIELDYFLDYPGTSSNKFLTPSGNGHLNCALDHLCSLPVVFQYWWCGFRVWVVSPDSLELNQSWCRAVGVAHSSSPFPFHPVFSPRYVNSDQHTHKIWSLVLAEIYHSPPLRSKGMGFPRNGAAGLHWNACEETLHCTT